MNRVKEIRIKKGVTQKELACAVGVSCPYMHDLENNARGAKPETWEKIAFQLGVQVNELYDEETKVS